jgi:hypothetical protein
MSMNKPDETQEAAPAEKAEEAPAEVVVEAKEAPVEPVYATSLHDPGHPLHHLRGV